MIDISNLQEIDLNKIPYLKLPLNKLFSFKPSKTNISYGKKLGIKRDEDNSNYDIFVDKIFPRIYLLNAIETEKDEGLIVLYKYKFLEESKNEILDLEKITVDIAYELLKNLSKHLDYHDDGGILREIYKSEIFTDDFDMYFNSISITDLTEIDRHYLLEYIMNRLEEFIVEQFGEFISYEETKDNSKIYDNYEKKISSLEKKLLESNVVEITKAVQQGIFYPRDYRSRTYFGLELEEKEREILNKLLRGSLYGLITELYNKDFDLDLKIRKLVYKLQETINSDEKAVIIKEIETMMISCDYKKLVSLIWSLITINHSSICETSGFGYRFIDNKEDKINGVEEFINNIKNISIIHKIEEILFRNYNHSQIYEVKERIIQLISILRNKGLDSEKFLLKLFLDPDYFSGAVINALDKNIDKKAIDDVIQYMDSETIELQRKKYKILNNLFSNKPEK